MKKRVLAAVLATMMAATMMAGCGKSETKSEAKKDSYTIGIEQFAEHGSLDNCREGFLKGLEDEGIKEGKNLKDMPLEEMDAIWNEAKKKGL